ncbi:rCG23711 [Rattus norvegicus]|uniref:RCG23711 n=1 Tax=Rattus norvegicus TaxID=10116 RepID=A6JWC8_RAT|nr:rCG23711 [Rattus norvegicus]
MLQPEERMRILFCPEGPRELILLDSSPSLELRLFLTQWSGHSTP